MSEVVDVPKSCASDGSCASVAAALPELKSKGTVTKGDRCDVSGTLGNGTSSSSGTYSVSGSTLITNGDSDRPAKFCVTGNTLVLEAVQERQIVYTTLTRK